MNDNKTTDVNKKNTSAQTGAQINNSIASGTVASFVAGAVTGQSMVNKSKAASIYSMNVADGSSAAALAVVQGIFGQNQAGNNAASTATNAGPAPTSASPQNK